MVSAFLASAQASQRTLLPGHLPAVVPGLQPSGRLSGSIRLKLSINLPLHNLDALTNLLGALYDSASPLYHHYLTPEEFDTRFGPTEQDYQAVIAWATSSGFTVTARHSNRTLLEVNAPVTNIERALQVTMRTYAHPTEFRTFFAPDTEPSVSTNIPILYIGGLDNFARPHPKNLRRAPLKISAKATAQIIGSGPNGNLAGFDYRAAYAPGVLLTGTGQMVGLVEFDGYYAGDIASYESQTGVPNVPLQTVLLDGFNGIPTTGGNSGNSEVALDIEMAISMAPGLSNVMVFEAGPYGQPNDVLEAMSTNTLIKQFSCSWDFGPITSAQRSAMDNYFMEFATQGQSFFDASGDTGAATGAITAPDDDPYTTLVGGTVLATAGPSSSWLSETVWNAQDGPGLNSSGGGVSSGSASYNIPSWQQGINMSSNKGSTTKRNSPDVAMVADNVFIVADNGQQETTGGTSCAAPLWAGFAALANQQAVTADLPTIGFVNPALYHIGTNSGYAACFDDITVGNNTNNNAAEYLAVPGYDLCTGWGSPSGGSLIIALTQPDGFQITPGRGAVANGPAGGPFTISTQTLSLTNTGTPAFNWSLGNTSVWLDVSSSSGTLTAGNGATSISLSLNPAADLLPTGVYTANLWFTNLSSGLGQLRQFTLQVNQELVQDGGFEAGDFCYWTLSGGSSIYNDNLVDDGTYTSYAPFAGNYFAALGQISDLAYLSQTLPTRAGQYYLLSFWLKNPSGSTPNQFLVKWNTNSASTNVIFNQLDMGTFGWSNMQFIVKASTNIATLQFGFRNDRNFFVLDNVSVIPMPESSITPPSISSQPTNQTVTLATTATFSASASGTTPLTYQWFKSSTKLVASSRISGVTTDTLTINNAATTDDGAYFMVVSNPFGSTASSNAILTVFVPDTTPPTLSITSPTSNQRWSNDVFNVTGTAKDNVGVANVFYLLNNTYWSNAVSVNNWTNWTASVALAPGTNTLQAYAVDTSGNVSKTNIVKFVYVLSAVLTVSTNGEGSISPAYNGVLLQIGVNYSMTATAKTGFGFTNWTDGLGNVLTNKATLKFAMESNLTFVANFVDTARPTNTITSPTANQRCSNDVFNVTGTARDNVGVTNVFYLLNSTGWSNAVSPNNWANWTASVTLTPGTNTLQAYAVDSSGNVSKTNIVKFVYVTVDWAPGSLNGLVAVITPEDQNTFYDGFWTNTFSQSSTDTNNYNGVGAYTYTKLSTNTAQLVINYTSPPTITGASASVFLMFTSNNICTFSNETDGADMGVITFSASAKLGPASFSGVKAIVVDSAGKQTSFSFNINSITITNSNGQVETATYTAKQYSPVGAMIVIKGSPATNYLELTFATTNYGDFFITTFDNSDEPTNTDEGVFVRLSQSAGGNAPASLAGTNGLVTQEGSPFLLSLDATTFSQTAEDTNNNNGAGGYTYTKLGANTAQLEINYSNPPTVTNDGRAVFLTFVAPDFCLFTNQDDLGSNYIATISLSAATNLVPASPAGLTFDCTNSAGVVDVVMLNGDGTFTQTETGSDNPGVSTGTYTYTTYSLIGAMVQLNFSGGVLTNSTTYFQTTFTDAGDGTFFSTFYDGSSNPPSTSSGTFAIH